MSRGIFGTLASLLVAAITCASVQTAAFADVPTAGTLSGHVYLPSGDPAAGISVQTTGSSINRSATTTSNGSFTITDVPFDVKNLSARPLPTMFAASVHVPIVVSPASPAVVQDITLLPGAEVVGTIKDESGSPIAGVSVGNFFKDTGTPGASGTVDKSHEDGTYRLTNLPVGVPGQFIRVYDSTEKYDWRFNGNTSHLFDAPDLSLTAGVVSTENFVLGPRGHFIGKVTDTDGNPVEGIYVEEYSARGPSWWSSPGRTKTKADGTYDLPAVSGNDMVLKFSDNTWHSFITQYDDGASTLQQARQHSIAPHQTSTVNEQFNRTARVYVRTPNEIELTAFTLSGTAKFGSTLSVSPAYPWVPSRTSATTQWLRDGVVITGATSSQRVITVDDIGHRLSARVTGKAVGWNDRTYTSIETAPVAGGGPLDVDAEALRTPHYYGEYVRASFTGSATGFTTTYAWRRDGTPISGTAAHKIEKPDIGHRLSANVTVSKPGYESKTFDLGESAVQQARTEVASLKVSATRARSVSFNLALRSATVSPLWLDGTVLVQEVQKGKRVTLRTFAIRDGKISMSIGKRSAGSHTYYVRYTGVSGVITPVEASVRALL